MRLNFMDHSEREREKKTKHKLNIILGKTEIWIDETCCLFANEC